MRILAIGVFKSNQAEECLLNNDSVQGKAVAEYIKNDIIAHLRKLKSSDTDRIFWLRNQDTTYYLKTDGKHIYCFAAADDHREENLNHYFNIIADSAKNKQYKALHTQFLRQDNARAKIQDMREDVTETRLILLETLDKLFMRGERIERLVQQTNALANEDISFTKVHKKKRSGIWHRVGSIFTCNAPMGQPIDDMDMPLRPKSHSTK